MRPGRLNAYLLRHAISCPLKLRYMMEGEVRAHPDREGIGGAGRRSDTGSGVRETEGETERKPAAGPDVLWRSEVKIMMRRVLSLLYPGGREAGKDHGRASARTKEWLSGSNAIVYGGVAVWGNCSARLPVMIREGDRLTLLQVHGKLWKYRERSLTEGIERNRTLLTYAREAAYKKWIVGKLFPGLEMTVRLCFPNPGFRSGTGNLYGELAFDEARAEDVSSLLIEVEADRAVDRVLQGGGTEEIHPVFRGKTFSQQMKWIADRLESTSGEMPFVVSDACRTCSFRTGMTDGDEGCWEKQMETDYSNPGLHVYDLIGRGSPAESGGSHRFQEDVPLPEQYGTFRDIADRSERTITMQQRRSLQLLSARNNPLPAEWLKKDLVTKIRDLSFPLHFLDFEAAASAVPMVSGGRPYSRVLFQFSCHTLQRDGRLIHSQWLDSEPRGKPHVGFVRELARIPAIGEGTVVQYSPFEKQALIMLYREFSGGSDSSGDSDNEELAGKLRNIIKGYDPEGKDRFLDLNRMTRDFYYNREMNSGLGLKQVLMSTLKISRHLQNLYGEAVDFDGDSLRLVQKRDGNLVDPYSLIQDEHMIIDEGSSAMHAWLYTKTPYCGEQTRKQIQKALRRYCMLDSLALVMIYQHWAHLVQHVPAEEDLIVRE